MIWIVFAVLLAVALFLLLRPLLRPTAAINDARTSELAVYRDQLRELETDLARGIISASEADAARNEIKRKMLAVAPAPNASRDPKRATRLTIVTVGAGIPVLSVGRPARSTRQAILPSASRSAATSSAGCRH
jgi:cytochrome c-type biogenesis protein CcmH